MDKNDSGNKEIPEEVARESLIALSYTEPPKDPATGCLPEKPNGQDDEAVSGDEAEKFRSELISISYTPSPETTPAPEGMPGELNG